MRTFISIEFPNELKLGLKKIQNNLLENSVSGKWPTENNFHLTLRFLDDIQKSQIPDIKKAMDESIHEIDLFNLELKGLNFFGSQIDYRVVYLELKKNKFLLNLFNNLDSNLNLIGFKKESKSFSPHITIGINVKLQPNVLLKNILGEYNFVYPVDNIYLMKSDFINFKHIYTPILKTSFIVN